MTRELTLDERVKALDALEQARDDEWVKVHGGAVRGPGPAGTIEVYRKRVSLWFKEKADNDEFIHIHLDKAGAPRFEVIDDES